MVDNPLVARFHGGLVALSCIFQVSGVLGALLVLELSASDGLVESALVKDAMQVDDARELELLYVDLA
jgi:hypothetical protein